MSAQHEKMIQVAIDSAKTFSEEHGYNFEMVRVKEALTDAYMKSFDIGIYPTDKIITHLNDAQAELTQAELALPAGDEHLLNILRFAIGYAQLAVKVAIDKHEEMLIR